MALETFTGIWSLNSANPVGGTDPKSQGDDHIRGVKYTLTYTFPNIKGVVSASDGEINMLVGVTSSIQTQINAKAPINSPSFGGTASFTNLAVSGTATFTTSPTAPTPTTGDATTKVATTAFVSATAFASSLPSQSGAVAGFKIMTDGASASWDDLGAEYLYLADNYT